MAQLRRMIWAGFAMFVPAAAYAGSVASCATCAKEVTLTKSEIKCVSDRVSKQILSALDLVIVATSGCSGKLRDGTRMEAVRQGRPVTKAGGRNPSEPYLLTKSDAVCFLRKLKLVDPKTRDLRIDLRNCG